MTTRELAIRRIPATVFAAGPLRATGLVLPASFGSARHVDVLMAVANATYRVARRDGVPVAHLPAGARLSRAVASTRADNRFRDQCWFPPPLPAGARPLFRASPIVRPMATTVGLSEAQRAVLDRQSRYLAADVFGVRDERIRYAKDAEFSRAWREGRAGIDWGSVNGAAFGGLSMYRFRVLADLTAIDNALTSPAFQELVERVAADDLVRQSLGAAGHRSLPEALAHPYDHSASQGCALGCMWAAPEVRALQFRSAQGRRGEGRLIVAMYGAAGTPLSGLASEGRLDFTLVGGRIDLSASSATLDDPAPGGLPTIELGM